MKIAVADNQFLTREGLISAISGNFRDAELITLWSVSEMLRLIDSSIDLLVIDPDSFPLNDVVELSIFRKRNPGTSILVVTLNKQYSFIQKIAGLGIESFIFKDSDDKTLNKAIRSAIMKESYFEQEALDILKKRSTYNKDKAVLTKSETEIVKLIAHGLTTKQIAAQKFLSHHTVITHRKNIFRKLGINNISELLMYAVNSGIIDTTEYFI